SAKQSCAVRRIGQSRSTVATRPPGRRVGAVGVGADWGASGFVAISSNSGSNRLLLVPSIADCPHEAGPSLGASILLDVGDYSTNPAIGDAVGGRRDQRRRGDAETPLPLLNRPRGGSRIATSASGTPGSACAGSPRATRPRP